MIPRIDPNTSTFWDKGRKWNATSSQDAQDYTCNSNSTPGPNPQILKAEASAESRDLSQFDVPRITRTARERLEKYENITQVSQALKLIEAIENLSRGYEDLNLPIIYITAAEDDSLALNWRVGTALFGAAIQPNPSESSWYLIQGDVERGYKADGYLDDLDSDTQLPAIFNLLIKTHIKHRKKNGIAT
jgi:hypothetical protein